MKVIYPSEVIYFLDTNSYQLVAPTGFLPYGGGIYVAQFDNLPLYRVRPVHAQEYKYLAEPRRIKGDE